MKLCEPAEFLAQVKIHEGKTYLYSFKGPLFFDCSGLVTYGVLKAGGPDLRDWHNCQRLWENLVPLEQPKPGQVALVFYGAPTDHGPHASHVMVVVGDGSVYGACGGDSSTVTVELARRRKAMVRYRPSATYRPGLLGYRLLEYRDDKLSEMTRHG